MTAVPSVPVPDLDTIRQRADKATPGPWQWTSGLDARCVVYGPDDLSVKLEGHADAEFIAHARTDVPALFAALVAVEAERDTLAAKIEAAEGLIQDSAHPDWCGVNDGPLSGEGHGHCTRGAAVLNVFMGTLRRALSVVPGEREDKT